MPGHVGPCSGFGLTDKDSIADAVTKIDAPPELALVTAGIWHNATRNIFPGKTMRSLYAASMTRAFAINPTGPALIAKHMLPRLPRERRAVFAVLSAGGGSNWRQPAGGWHAYRASKAALDMMVVNFTIEMRRPHPEVIVVALPPAPSAPRFQHPFRAVCQQESCFRPPRQRTISCR
ncbi:SDR family NAD(P)-dependent oxidoreductase [Komagataeibacter oboediens]|uniref:SDR family NAD(P)-dependent oxidoreductase n=1 Tax=Komagataeibacter oboediens TaxID=65958 RepID=UPI001A4D2703|nr:SDR family NAD(P)-dependent oxidoreductase [Komagataeibacter oboediens]MBL7234400.1 SDR family NAD(P)-dependent oxidoreductase [Komagataeibacter oboediens]